MDKVTFTVLAVLILGAGIADQVYFDGEGLWFLGRQMERIVEWLAFWR